MNFHNIWEGVHLTILPICEFCSMSRAELLKISQLYLAYFIELSDQKCRNLQVTLKARGFFKFCWIPRCILQKRPCESNWL